MASLVERYYNLLQAPHKELIWFEHAGHGLLHRKYKSVCRRDREYRAGTKMKVRGNLGSDQSAAD